MYSLKKKEKLILSFMRTNSRENLTKISRQTRIPVSTIFDKLKRYENGIIRKNTCIIDFKAIGYGVKANIFFNASIDTRDKICDFVLRNRNTNSFIRINNGYDYLAEVIFKDMHGLQEFIDAITQMKAKNIRTHFVLEEFKREEFLSNPQEVIEEEV